MRTPGHAASRVRCALAFAWLMLLGANTPAQASTNFPTAAPAARLTLIVPGTSGGGWDLTAQAMKEALTTEGIAKEVSIVRYPGASGLVGISQFVSRHAGDGNAMMVGGLVMLGATMRDEAAVTLRDVTPVARLTGDWGVIVVPSESKLRNAGMLREIMTDTPDALRWAGGALGGPDQGLIWSIATFLGVPLDEVPYYGKPGGRRVAESLIQGRHNIAASGYAEFAPFIRSGHLRVLAVAAPHRLPGVDAPTLTEAGIDVSVMNWRGAFAPPGLTDGQEARLADIVARMTQSATWKQALARHRWSDTYLDRTAFGQFLNREQMRWPALINPPRRANGHAIELRTDLSGLPLIQAALALVALIAAIAALMLREQKRKTEQRQRELEEKCATLSSQLVELPSATMKLVREGVDDDFGQWNLSFAERDIAWFMLRGLPLKEIAGLRGTSERTVRQQAQAIYRKAGLEGRSDLAGRVLERFI